MHSSLHLPLLALTLTSSVCNHRPPPLPLALCCQCAFRTDRSSETRWTIPSLLFNTAAAGSSGDLSSAGVGVEVGARGQHVKKGKKVYWKISEEPRNQVCWWHCLHLYSTKLCSTPAPTVITGNDRYEVGGPPSCLYRNLPEIKHWTNRQSLKN